MDSEGIKEIEKKWMEIWEREKIYKVTEDIKKKKYYVLEMFPYPSGTGLHMGHAFNYTIGDIYARFKRMCGYNVLYPMGYDSFGLPAENAAIKEGIHPKIYTENAIRNFISQQKRLGLSYDWDRVIFTHKEDYYKWDQWIFCQMYKKGLIYRKKAPVNYCPKCKTVLANEQVHDGKCWRHKDTNVEIRNLEQWFIKITAYADELYEKIDSLNWPEGIKAMQKEWIGKSHGINIKFDVNGKEWEIFTTRPDTIFGVTFLVISAQHPRLDELVTDAQRKEVEEFLRKIKSTKKEDVIELEKEGVFTGSYAKNPATGEKVPIYIGNFVVYDYGSGMVMAVPAHDQRDFEFAKRYGLPIKVVITKEGKSEEEMLEEIEKDGAYVDEGFLINSGEFSGLDSKTAREKICDWLEKRGLGKRTVLFKLRDWLISRQRYWGTPIPIVYCKRCGTVLDERPVTLPENVEFGEGNPIASCAEFVQTKCPKCGGDALRETDTMDTFVNSSWYFLRYCDPKNDERIFDREKVSYWTPIDIYIGGAEHACMHLIYFRFYTKFLRDIGLIDFDEPAVKLFNQGMVHGSDGFVMSKSRGNVVDPMQTIEKYGADTLRLYLVSNCSPSKDFSWSDVGIESTFKFIRALYDYSEKIQFGPESRKTRHKINRLIKKVTEYIENLEYNLAIIELKSFFNYIKDERISPESWDTFLKLLHPFCPFFTQEAWSKVHHSFISLEPWPEANESEINDQFELWEKISKDLIADITNIISIMRKKGKMPKRCYVYILPNEFEHYLENEKEIRRSIEGIGVELHFVKSNEASYDPLGKAKNAKPKKPAIYLE
jgi:leucyl-tRNA synthetase